MEERRLFTLEQANALIPQLDELFTELIALRNELVEQARALGEFGEKVPHDGGGHRANQYVINLQHLSALLETIHALGCEIKDLQAGLVDFPADRDGRIVYLCWKRGEKRIEYWHELDTGFAGRQPL